MVFVFLGYGEGGKLDSGCSRDVEFLLVESVYARQQAQGYSLMLLYTIREAGFEVSPRFCVWCHGAEHAFFLTVFHECSKLHCLL